MSTNAHEQTRYVADEWENFYTSAVFAGIVGDPAHQVKGGYHISIEDNSSTNYSVVRPDDKAPPGTWPRNLAAGIDMSMSPTDMKLCSDRLWDVWNDLTDPRRNYVNGFNGWFNDGGPAKRYDFVTQKVSETTSDHKSHVHLEIRRKYVTDPIASQAIVSILRGDSKQAYLDGLTGDEMYAKYEMGLNGSPISHDTMYLQEMMLWIVNNDPDLVIRLKEHPLTVDGKYGDNTAYWVSVILTGGDGKEVTGKYFAQLNQQVMDKKIIASGGQTIQWPLKGTINFPGTTVSIPPSIVEVDIVEQE